MAWKTPHLWLPAVAASRYLGDCTGYEQPELMANDVGGLAEFSADGIQFGFSVFEGMRAYISEPAFQVFRARDHHERLQSSCAALALPCPPYDIFVSAIEQAVQANRDGKSKRLYVRPIVFAAGGDIMAQQSSKYVFAVLVKLFDPAPGGISILVEESMPRTVPMFERVKTAGNYTSAALAMRDASAAGWDTILWLNRDGYLQECTTMNIFLYLDGQFVTPRLGSILPGVTRRTVLDLLAASGERVSERDIHVSEVSEALARQKNLSVFTTSTALGIRTVKRLRLHSRDHALSDEVPDSLRRMEGQYSLVTKQFTQVASLYPAIMARSHIAALSDPGGGRPSGLGCPEAAGSDVTLFKQIGEK